MKKLISVFASVLCAALACLGQTASSSPAQRSRTTTTTTTRSAGAPAGETATPAAQLTGLYRIDLARSDKLYSVVAGASSNLPFGEQQKFFIDLTVRLTPPDLLAIERRGRRITLASSRAPRIDFDADGITHGERGGDGRIVNTLAALRGGSLTVSVSGQSDDKFNVTFEPLEGGRALRVTRRLSNEQLTQPVLIHSVYEKISGVPQWDIYDAPSRRPNLPPVAASRPPVVVSSSGTAAPAPRGVESDATVLRGALANWIAATNSRDIERQMTFYPPVLSAFYLTRNVTRAAVRAEKERVFLAARTVEVRADTPELIFQEAGQSAVMRFRKTYAVEGNGSERRGAVIQELRWRRTPQGWKIFSERDVRVIR
jgi:ketosteroid isomerase-like protein